MNFNVTQGCNGGVWNGQEVVGGMSRPEDTVSLPNDVNYLQTVDNGFTWSPPYDDRRNAFERVQEAILDEVTEAIKDDNMKRAKELLVLAKKLKELK